MNEDQDAGRPGLGLPEQGSGSLGGWARRIPALVLDWLIANLIARLIGGEEVWSPPVTALDALPLAVFAVMIWLLTAFAGGSIGQRLLGLVVTRLDGGPTGPVRGGLRTGLILLVIPPLVVDADGRGLHDRLAGTLIRRR